MLMPDLEKDVKWPGLMENRQYFDAFLMPVFSSSET